MIYEIEYKVRPDYLLDKKKTKSLVKKPNPLKKAVEKTFSLNSTD